MVCMSSTGEGQFAGSACTAPYLVQPRMGGDRLAAAGGGRTPMLIIDGGSGFYSMKATCEWAGGRGTWAYQHLYPLMRPRYLTA
jgi:hypothetical protein